MSKKKAFSGNTMSLKDFHGGSIPTDLPLPSAPGVFVRSNDWSGHDRPNSWGGRTSRPDHWVRPHSSPAIRHFDERTLFLSHNARIGRNFDEDERKPLDGFSAPRQTFSDDKFRVAPNIVDSVSKAALSKRVSGSSIGALITGSDIKRVHEASHMEVHAEKLVGNAGGSIGGSCPNAWTARKNEPAQPTWSEASALLKLAHASALEKVSSGRWQTNWSIHNQTNVEVVEHQETEVVGSKGYDGYTHSRIDVVGERENSDAMLTRHVEGGLAVEDRIQAHGKEFVDRERDRAPLLSELKERKPPIHVERVQPLHLGANVGGPILQPPVQPVVSERPKIKLLPRTKPLEDLESSLADHEQAYQLRAHDHAITSNGLHSRCNAAKPNSVDGESENKMVELQKLNLNPRSHPLEQLDGNIERERNQLFGGARPREVVLKERGLDGAAMSNDDLGQHFNRIPKNERVPECVTAPHNGRRIDSLPVDQRIVKKPEKKDQRVGTDRSDVQRGNWHNENWRNNRQTGRQQQQNKERRPSPETWRKPVEQPKPASLDAGLRCGKIASSLELAQAFSRSISNPKIEDRFFGQRGLRGNMRMPFSRLLAPTPRPQINGY